MGIRRKKTLLQQAAEYVEAAVDTAREKAGPALADAREKAGPALADAREKAGPVLADARDKAAPLIAQGAAIVSEKAADLKGQPKKKKHRLRKLLLLTGLASLVGFLYQKSRAGSEKDNWQSSYTPTPAPVTRDADATDSPIGDSLVGDEGGAAPDEAISDAAEESHDVTTPDEPADVVELEPDEEPAEQASPQS